MALVRLPLEVFSQIVQVLLDENEYGAIAALAKTGHGIRVFIHTEIISRLIKSFQNKTSYVVALGQVHQGPIILTPPIFNHRDGMFVFEGTYQLNPVFSSGFKVIVSFEDVAYILTSHLPAFNLRRSTEEYDEYDSAVEVGDSTGIPAIFSRRFYIGCRFSDGGLTSTLDQVSFKFTDIFNFTAV